jgi:20S proteasome alpha/beta subunit
MTCIVGVEYNNKVYMGSDSCGSNDFAKISIDAPKIFLSGDVLIGYAGFVSNSRYSPIRQTSKTSKEHGCKGISSDFRY